MRIHPFRFELIRRGPAALFVARADEDDVTECTQFSGDLEPDAFVCAGD